MLEIFKNYLSPEDCSLYASLIKDLGKGDFSWDERTVDITPDPIVEKVKQFLYEKTKVKLEIQKAELQNWNVGSESELHIHIDRFKGEGLEAIKYNSLIYLNDDFGGGEFYTKDTSIKPEKGMLTFFDGSQTYHGVKKVKKKDRKTIIFWWKK